MSNPAAVRLWHPQKIRLARAYLRLAARWYWRGDRAPSALDVAERVLATEQGPLRARVYTPRANGPLRTLLYFHGGGWSLGDLDTHDGTCRQLAVSSLSVVVSVDYRLAPEHPFPAAVEDAVAATRWLVANHVDVGGDPARLYLAGDSAGANLAAVAAQAVAGEGTIAGQVLVYPGLAHYDHGTESYRTHGRGHGLTEKILIFLWDTYLRGSGHRRHVLAEPLLAEDLNGVPRALLLLPELDPLRDEGLEYAKRLAEAGTPVQCSIYDGEEHGFLGTRGPTEVNGRGIQEISRWLREDEDALCGIDEPPHHVRDKSRPLP